MRLSQVKVSLIRFLSCYFIEINKVQNHRTLNLHTSVNGYRTMYVILCPYHCHSDVHNKVINCQSILCGFFFLFYQHRTMTMLVVFTYFIYNRMNRVLGTIYIHNNI